MQKMGIQIELSPVIHTHIFSYCLTLMLYSSFIKIKEDVFSCYSYENASVKNKLLAFSGPKILKIMHRLVAL